MNSLEKYAAKGALIAGLKRYWRHASGKGVRGVKDQIRDLRSLGFDPKDIRKAMGPDLNQAQAAQLKSILLPSLILSAAATPLAMSGKKDK